MPTSLHAGIGTHWAASGARYVNLRGRLDPSSSDAAVTGAKQNAPRPFQSCLLSSAASISFRIGRAVDDPRRAHEMLQRNQVD